MTLIRKSESKFAGVDAGLVSVVREAAQTLPFDIQALEGLRSTMRQAELVAAHASQTMDSAHLTGEALDLAPVIGGEVRWDWPPFYVIADHMAAAGKRLGVKLIWGGCWDREVTEWGAESAESISAGYVTRRKAQGRKAFLDGPHWQIFERKPRV